MRFAWRGARAAIYGRESESPKCWGFKYVMLVNPFTTAEIDFIADNPGLTLFHCHAQLHMDFAFMNLIKYT